MGLHIYRILLPPQ